MKKDLLFALIQNPNLIPGIYNYCDGWCERCSFTSNCLNYKTMEEGVADISDQENKSDLALDHLDDMFNLSMELFNQAAKDLGMELPEVNEDYDPEIEEAKDEIIFNSQIMLQADKYSEMVDDWFANYETLVYVGSRSLKDLIENHDDDFVIQESKQILEAIEFIRWYQFIIPSKLFRAMKSRNKSLESNNEFYEHDSVASAKVALIAIDKSIESWTVFMNTFSNVEDSMLPTLLLLSGVRTLVEGLFPEARDFVRPGFDI